MTAKKQKGTSVPDSSPIPEKRRKKSTEDQLVSRDKDHPDLKKPNKDGNFVPKKKDHLFKKGQSGNPKGLPKMPPEILELRRLGSREFIRIATTIMFMNTEDLIQIYENRTKYPAIVTAIASILLFGIQKGDPDRLAMILDRIVGKPADFLVMKGSFEQKSQTLINIDIMKNDQVRNTALEFAQMAMQSKLIQIKREENDS